MVSSARHSTLTIWHGIVSVALRPVPYYTRWGFYLQAFVILVCLVWLQWWPLIPTVAIGFLGVVAVIMTVRADHFSHAERVVWTMIAVALFLTEMHSVYKDRNEHDAQQAETRERETENFEKIAGRITNAIEKSDHNFAEVMKRSNRILGGVTDTIKTETGGDSFAFITFTPEPANVQFNRFPAASGPQFLVSITSHGKYPLRQIHGTMMDDERRLAAMEEYNKHPNGAWIAAIQSADTEYQYPYLRPQSPEGPSGDVELLGMYPFPKGDSNRLSIAFSSLNGYWNEALHLARVNGKWHQCLSVMGPTVKQATKPFIYCDSDWPEGRVLAEKDWSRPKQAPRHPRNQ